MSDTIKPPKDNPNAAWTPKVQDRLQEQVNALRMALDTEMSAANLYAKQVAHWIEKHDALREPIIDEMDAVASKYAHKLALDLECVLSDYNGKWWDTAMQTIGEYRMAMNRIHERESPTHMGEPVLPKISSGVGK